MNNSIQLIIDTAPYISKYLREEIEFERENDSFFPVTSIYQSQLDSLNKLVEQAKSISFDFGCIVFDVSDLATWNFMDEYPTFLDEEKFEDYFVKNLTGFDECGVDVLGEKGLIFLENPPQDLLEAQSFIPLYKEPKSKKNIDLDPPAWVVQSVKFVVNPKAGEFSFVWHIWERTMSIHISDGERYFMLESRNFAFDSLFELSKPD